MNRLAFYACILILSFTLSNCKSDCEGSYTIEGIIWNGTKNTPRSGITIEAVAGKNNSLFSTGSNVKDLGKSRTDNNGYFKITYDCDDEMTSASIHSPNLSPNTIAGFPINQNINRTFNIPDSITLIIKLAKINGLGMNDTLYLLVGNQLANMVYFTQNTFKTGTIMLNRFDYLTSLSINQSLPITHTIGYSRFIEEIKKPWIGAKNLTLLEPDINTYTISY